MQVTAFSAKCPYEIGDAICVKSGISAGKSELLMQNVRVITDIACIHLLKSGVIEFRYEFDRDGIYVPIQSVVGGNG